MMSPRHRVPVNRRWGKVGGISKLVVVNDDQAENLLADILHIYHTFVSDHCDVKRIP